MDLIIETLFHACVHAGVDCLKMLPFLFAAFLLIEALEHHGSRKLARGLARVGKAGPVAGALVGCIPQCGFSVIAANLYAGGVISPGTLLAVFVATSDEAVLILLGNPGSAGEVLPLLAGKILIAVLAGYVTDLVLRGRIEEPREVGELCHHCGCHTAGAADLPLSLCFYRDPKPGDRSLWDPAAFHISTGGHPGAAPCGGSGRADPQLRGFRDAHPALLKRSHFLCLCNGRPVHRSRGGADCPF